MSEAKFTKGPWVACVSSSGYLDICTAIKDKGNGNCIVANDIDEDYETLLLVLPEMYAEIERDVLEIEARLKFADKRTLAVNPDFESLERKKALLAKARGEQDED